MRKQPAAGRWLVLLALLAAARLTLAVLHPDEWAFEARRMYVVDNWDRQRIVDDFARRGRTITKKWVSTVNVRAAAWSGDPRAPMVTGAIRKTSSDSTRNSVTPAEQVKVFDELRARRSRFSHQIRSRLAEGGARLIPESTIDDQLRRADITWKKLEKLNSKRDEQQVATFVEHLHTCDHVMERICCLDASHVSSVRTLAASAPIVF